MNHASSSSLYPTDPYVPEVAGAGAGVVAGGEVGAGVDSPEMGVFGAAVLGAGAGSVAGVGAGVGAVSVPPGAGAGVEVGAEGVALDGELGASVAGAAGGG